MKKFLSILSCFIALIMLIACLYGCDTKKEAQEQTYEQRLVSCKEQIEKITDFKPEVIVVLGTGLGDYVNGFNVKATIPYGSIKGFPVSTAPTHAGNLVFAEYKGLNLAIMQGRIHQYEGYSAQEVVLPLRVLHLLGANTLILTNSVGSLNENFRPGEFVCVKDQISSFVPSPLIGQNDDEMGPRFVGMVDAFDPDMRNTVLQVGQENNIAVHSGVYIQVTGPQFETPTEIQMYRALGADTIAMSMADEVLAARHAGMKVCGINCISNMGAGMESDDFTEEQIEQIAEESVQKLQVLLDGLFDSLTAK